MRRDPRHRISRISVKANRCLGMGRMWDAKQRRRRNYTFADNEVTAESRDSDHNQLSRTATKPTFRSELRESTVVRLHFSRHRQMRRLTRLERSIHSTHGYT
jgi:hypothetical protein